MRERVSVVVPLFEERESLAELLTELAEATRTLPDTDFEFVLVDDGSRDGTHQAAEAARKEDPRIVLVRHSRNRGKSAALLSGFAAARAPILVTLDGDLQNPPAEVPRLLATLEEGAWDAVLSVRAERQDSWRIRVASRVGNALRRWMLGDSALDVGCGLMAFRSHLAEGLPRVEGLHRYLPSIWASRGARMTQIPVAHLPRRHGKSKYTIGGRAWKGIFDLIGMRWWITRSIDRRDRNEEDES